MGWFAVDDGFDNHPKIRKAGNAAAGLFCRLGAYSSRSATEGLIPGPVARDYGTAAQLRKLGELRMIHSFGHACPDCPQPEPGGFIMHDYLQYNRSRKEIETARKAGVERQRKRRARLAEDAANAETATPTGVSGGVSGGVAPGGSGGVSGATPPRAPVPGMNSRSEAPVTADVAEERARTSPAQPHYVPPNGGTSSQQDALAHVGDRPRIPEASRPLVERITAAGMIVGWDLQAAEWFLIEALIKKCGIDHLAVSAADMWHKAKERPRRGNYFLPGWKALPEVPAGTPTLPQPLSDELVPTAGPNVYPITGNRRQPTGTDANLAGHAALIAQLEALEAQS